MARIGIVTPPSAGLIHSESVLERALTSAGHEVHGHRTNEPSFHVRYDVVIFMEVIRPAWFGVGRHNVLVPSPEWFKDKYHRHLDRIDVVFAMTRDAVTTFEGLGCTVTYTGFTSHDRWDPDVPKDMNRWLHVAGKNRWKGTKTVVDVWRANPDFPPVKVAYHGLAAEKYRSALEPVPDNVELHEELVADDVLREWQNECGVHVCISEQESWGHTIVEGMSTKAVIITTDGTPMNEVVTTDRGVLCPAAASEPQRLGTNYRVAPDALARTVQSVLSREPSELQMLGENARSFFLDNDQAFGRRLTAAVDGVVCRGRGQGWLRVGQTRRALRAARIRTSNRLGLRRRRVGRRQDTRTA